MLLSPLRRPEATATREGPEPFGSAARTPSVADHATACHGRAMVQTIPPRYSPAELIAELREAAEEIAPELNGIRPEETLEGESAQTLEEMQEALRRIASGAPNPQEIARAALAAKAPLRPFGKPRNTVVKMPRPKSAPPRR